MALLSCPVSLALMLLAVNPATPSTLISQNRSIEPNGQIPVNPGINQDESESSLPEINSDKIGNLATLTLWWAALAIDIQPSKSYKNDG